MAQNFEAACLRANQSNLKLRDSIEFTTGAAELQKSHDNGLCNYP